MKIKQPDPQHETQEIHAALGKVLIMATASTADNERDFAHHTKHFLRTCRGLAHDDWRMAERQVSEACSGKSEAFLQKVAVQAQLIWVEGFNRHRLAGQTRMNFISKKKKKCSDPKSLESFVRSRRKAVKEAVRAADFQGSTSSELLSPDFIIAEILKINFLKKFNSLWSKIRSIGSSISEPVPSQEREGKSTGWRSMGWGPWQERRPFAQASQETQVWSTKVWTTASGREPWRRLKVL